MAQSKTTGRVITRAVIKGLMATGAVTMALAAPNSTQLIDRYLAHINQKDARRTLRYLKYHKLIEVIEKDGEQYYRLTSKGMDGYERIVIDELTIKSPKRWDKKWRLVMFDIPLSSDTKRKRFINKLAGMNFYMLQKSAWIHPFECEKEIGTLIHSFRLEKHVSFMVIESGNFNDYAIQHFKKVKILI